MWDAQAMRREEVINIALQKGFFHTHIFSYTYVKKRFGQRFIVPAFTL